MGRSSPLLGSLLLALSLAFGGCAATVSGGGGGGAPDDDVDPRTPSAPRDPDAPGPSPTDPDVPEPVVDPVRITVELPAPGSFIEGDTLRIVGSVQGPATEIRIGDEVVALDGDGRFDVSRIVEPGAHRVRLSAGEGDGAASTYVAAIVGSFAAPGERVAQAATVALGPSALRELARGAAALLSRQDFEGLAMGANPVMDAWWGEARISHVTHGAIDVVLHPEDGTLVVAAAIRDLDVGIELDPSIGPTLGGNLGASVVRLEVPAYVEMIGGEPSVTLGAASVSFDGFFFMLDYVPSFIENSNLVRDAVRSRIETAIETAAADALPGYLERALASLPTSGQLDAAGVPIGYDARLSALSVSTSGLSASVDLGIAAVAPVEGRGAQGAIRFARGGLPANATSDVGLSVALDALNAAAMALWASGRLDTSLPRVPFGERELTVGALTLLVRDVGRGIDGSLPMSVSVRAALPPVARTRPDGSLELFLADVPVDLAAETPEGATHLLSVSVAARVAVTPRVVDGAMTVELGTIELDLDGIDIPPATAEVIANLVRDLVLPQLTSTLSIPSFRVPTVYGFRLDAEQLAVREGYVTFGGSLRYTE